MNEEEEPFLKRWSRRKAEARREPAQEGEKPPADPSAPEAGAAPGPAAEAAPARPLTEADFADVDFDALDASSDYTRFLAPGVPEAIRQKALRKLWASDPVLSAVEPFQEYAGDFTDAAVAVAPGTLRTAYRVGKGFLTDEEVAEWERLGRPPEEAQPGAAPAAAAAASAAGAGPETAVTVGRETPDQPEVHAMLRQSDAYFAALYPAEANHLVGVEALSAANVRFLVARRAGAAVGCGALVLGTDGEAELKRMFVLPEARGGGIGARVLEALEAAAREEGVRVIRLETGVRQPEALALYRGRGYTERGPFGAYVAHPLSRYFEKWIA